MDNTTLIGMSSILGAALCMGLGSIGPAIGEGLGLARALTAMAQQPDEAGRISRTLFVGMAMIESTAIYCLVVAVILIFANPFWNQVISNTGGQ
jgi:F-type H+-transporting ATPase subunit c